MVAINLGCAILDDKRTTVQRISYSVLGYTFGELGIIDFSDSALNSNIICLGYYPSVELSNYENPRFKPRDFACAYVKTSGF